MSYKIKTPNLAHTLSTDWLNVYEPAEDTFLMLDALENDLDYIHEMRPLVCLEVGSGAGVTITAISHEFQTSAHCIAIDINNHACKMTRLTAQRNLVNVDVIQGDLMQTIKPHTIDMVLFNPPYVVTPSEEIHNGDMLTKSWAGGINGREVIDRFLELLDACLSEEGFGYILLLKENYPDEVASILEDKHFLCQVVASRKLRGEELCVLRFTKKNLFVS